MRSAFGGVAPIGERLRWSHRPGPRADEPRRSLTTAALASGPSMKSAGHLRSAGARLRRPLASPRYPRGSFVRSSGFMFSVECRHCAPGEVSGILGVVSCATRVLQRSDVRWRITGSRQVQRGAAFPTEEMRVLVNTLRGQRPLVVLGALHCAGPVPPVAPGQTAARRARRAGRHPSRQRTARRARPEEARR